MYAAPSLHKLQTEFAGWMLGRHYSGLPDAVTGNGLAPEARLKIYRNVIFNNLIAARQKSTATHNRNSNRLRGESQSRPPAIFP